MPAYFVDWNIGDKCEYGYKGPHGFSVVTEWFHAEIMGFTRKRVKIRAIDEVAGDTFDTTVLRQSLREIESGVEHTK